METGAVIIEEPVTTKTHIEEALAGVILDQSFMEVGKKNLNTVLDDEITSLDSRNNIIPGETQFAKVVNGSGNKEEATKSVSVAEESKISETDKDEPESFNTNKEDVKILLTDVSLEKEKEDSITREPEKACEEILKDEKDSTTVETSVNGTEFADDVTISVEEISKNITNQTVPEEETVRDDESVNDVATTKSVEIEEEMKIDAEPSLNVIEKVEAQTVKTVIEDPKIKNEETTVLESESLKANAEPEETIRNSEDAEQSLNVIEKVESKTVKTSVEDTKIDNNEEIGVHETESLKANAEPEEKIRNSEDAEPSLHVIKKGEEEETVKIASEDPIEETTLHESESLKASAEPEEADQIADREKEEVQDIPSVIETQTIQGEDIEEKVSVELKEEVEQCSKDTEKHEKEAVNTSTVKDATLLKSLETNINETVAVHNTIDGEEEEADVQETKKDTETSLDLKEGIEEEETEMVKTVISSDEVRSSDVLGEHNETFSSEIKDESHGIQEETIEEKHENVLDVASTESEKHQYNEPEIALVTITEKPERFEELPSDLVLKVDKEELKAEKIQVDQVDETQTIDEQREQNSNEPETEQIDQNRTDETEERPTEITVGQVEQTRDIEPSLIEKFSTDQTLQEEQVKEACFRDDQQKEETETNGESLHNVEKEEDATQKTEEMKETPSVIETLIVQGEDIESKASLAVKEESDQSSKDAEEHEHKLGRDITQCGTLKAEAVDTSTVQEAVILKNLETEDKETRSSDQVDAQSEEFVEHTGPCSSEIKDERKGREESVEVKSKETIQDERSEDKDVESGESEKCQDNKPEISPVSNTESREDIPSDLAFDCTQTMEVPRSLELNDPETERIEQVAVADAGLDETTQNQTFVDVESLEKMQTSSLESPELSKEDVTVHQEGQEEGSNGLDTKEEIVSVPDSSELEAKAHEEESCLPNEEEKETKLQEKQIEKHEPTKEEEEEEVTENIKRSLESVEIVEPHCSLPSSSEEQHHGTVAETIKIEDIKENEEEEEVTDEIKRSLDSGQIVEPHSSLLSSSEKQHLGTVAEAKEIEEIKENEEEEEEVTDEIKRSLESVEIVESHSSLPILSEKNDDETLNVEAEKGDEEVTVGLDISKTNHEDFEKLEASKLEEVKEDKSEDVSETNQILSTEKSPSSEIVSELHDQISREVEGIHEEETKEAHNSEVAVEQFLQVETLQTDQTTSLVSVQDYQIPKEVEETNEEETKEAHKLHEEEIIPTEPVPNQEVSKQERSQETTETTEATEATGDETPKQVEEIHEETNEEETKEAHRLHEEEIIPTEAVPNLEASKQERSEETTETTEATEASGDQTPKKVEEIHEDETMEVQKLHEDEIISTEAVPNQEVSKQERSQETTETTAATEATGEEIHEETNEEETKEAHKLHEEEIIPTEAVPNVEVSKQERSQETTETTEVTEASGDETAKQVEEIHEDETMKVQKLREEQILPTKTVPEESFDEAPVSMLASGEQEPVTLKEGNSVGEVRDTDETQEERPVSAETKPIESDKPNDQVETSSYPLSLERAIEVTKVEEPEAPKLEESKEVKSREIQEITEVVKATGDQTLPIETLQEDQTLSSELVSRLDDQISSQAEEIHEEETKEEHKFEATGDQTLPTETSQADETLSSELVSRLDDQSPSQAEEIHEEETKEEHKLSSDLASGLDDQTPKQVEEIHEEEEKEAHKSQVASDQSLLAETSQADQTESLVSEVENQTPENVNDIHEEETKEPHSLQVETDQILPIETSHEDQTPSLVSEQDEQTPKQADKIHEEKTIEVHKLQAEEIPPTETISTESFSEAPVSMLASREYEPVTLQEGQFAGDTQEESHVSAETEPKESDEQVDTSTNLTKVEDENTTKPDIEVAELTNGESKLNIPENACLKQEELKETEDETISNLPVVEILKGLQTTLETERATNESPSLIEQAEIVQKTGEAKVESNEEDSAAEIVEANRLQQDECGETAKVQEEKSLADKSLPIEELNLQDEDKEEVKVQDVISREFKVSVEKKLQEEEIREIAEKQEERKEQEDVNASTAEKISLQEEKLPRDFEISKKVEDNSDQVLELPEDQTQTEQKPEIHQTVKEEDQIVATRDIEEIFSFEVKKEQEEASDLGVEKEVEPHSLLGNDVEIKEEVTSEKQIIDPVMIIKKSEHESNEEHVEPQAISDDAKTYSDRDFPTEQAPKEQREEVNADKSLIKETFDEQTQVPSSALQDDQDQSYTHVEETSFKANEKDKETAEQEQKSNDLTYVQEDNGKTVKLEVPGDGYDSVVALKQEGDLIEEKKEVEYVKTELEDAIKHGVSVQENNLPEQIDVNAKKEIKPTEIVTAIKEESKEEEELNGGSKDMPAEKKTEETMLLQKETEQESMKNTNDAIHKTQPEILETESLSSVSKTHYVSKQEVEVPNQQKREIADEVLKPKNLKNAEESQQKDGESEPARKSLSDLIQKVKATKETEDATRESHVEEELKTEEEEDEHKEDKTSPDSIVMVEAKDTVSIIKTQKKSHGILSGVGSKVKHSISKVKKVLTGKSSHTSKPTSPE